MRRSRIHLRRQILTLFVVALSAVAMWASQLSEATPAPLTPAIQQELFGGTTTASEQLEIGRAHV